MPVLTAPGGTRVRRVERRWPPWVYRGGSEPDPRFSLANERTFLSWIRTALAFLAGGVALQALPLAIHPTTRHWLGITFLALAVLTAAAGWVRWARAERAMRRQEPLPGAILGALIAAAVVLTAVVLLVTLGVG